MALVHAQVSKTRPTGRTCLDAPKLSRALSSIPVNALEFTYPEFLALDVPDTAPLKSAYVEGKLRLADGTEQTVYYQARSSTDCLIVNDCY